MQLARNSALRAAQPCPPTQHSHSYLAHTLRIGNHVVQHAKRLRRKRAGKHDLLKHKANQRYWSIFDGWRTKVRNTNYLRYYKRWQTSMSKATTSITPCPQTFNVERKCHELALRNCVPPRGLSSQSLQHANIELGGNGVYAKSAMYVQCTHARVANFCPSTVLSQGSCIDTYIWRPICKLCEHDTTLQNQTNQLICIKRSTNQTTKTD